MPLRGPHFFYSIATARARVDIDVPLYKWRHLTSSFWGADRQSPSWYSYLDKKKWRKTIRQWRSRCLCPLECSCLLCLRRIFYGARKLYLNDSSIYSRYACTSHLMTHLLFLYDVKTLHVRASNIQWRSPMLVCWEQNSRLHNRTGTVFLGAVLSEATIIIFIVQSAAYLRHINLTSAFFADAYTKTQLCYLHYELSNLRARFLNFAFFFFPVQRLRAVCLPCTGFTKFGLDFRGEVS